MFPAPVRSFSESLSSFSVKTKTASYGVSFYLMKPQALDALKLLMSYELGVLERCYWDLETFHGSIPPTELPD